MNNIKYFVFSQNNNDFIIDTTRQKGVLVISRNKTDQETDLMIANHNLIELITTYKTLIKLKNSNKENLDSIVDNIIYIIEKTKQINYSSFCVYFQVIGYSYNKYMTEKSKMNLEEKRNLFKKIIDLYIDNRHDIYLFHGYSDQVLQIGSDISSSRRKGKIGIEMIEDILRQFKFKKAVNLPELRDERLAYILPDKGQKEIFNNYLKELDITFKFRATRDDKNPDFLLKIKKDIFIMEHKLTNGGGGSQNAEINEIIQFINYEESHSENIHYVSCLDGDFFEKLHDKNTEPKTKSQFNNIMNALNNYPGNYFVNGNGLSLLIKDLINNDD